MNTVNDMPENIIADNIIVRRSPAKVCWHVLYKKTLLGTADTKKAAEALRIALRGSIQCL